MSRADTITVPNLGRWTWKGVTYAARLVILRDRLSGGIVANALRSAEKRATAAGGAFVVVLEPVVERSAPVHPFAQLPLEGLPGLGAHQLAVEAAKLAVAWRLLEKRGAPLEAATALERLRQVVDRFLERARHQGGDA